MNIGYAEFDPSTIHVERWGEEGPSVVLVHGGAQGSSAGGARHFSAQRSLADDGWQLIVPDRPGHGLSPSQGWPDDADRDGAWVAELIGPGAHLVGHSFGAAVALAATVRRPDAVWSLTLIEPAMHGLAASDPAVRALLIRLILASLLTFSPARRAVKLSRLLGIQAEMSSGRDPVELVRMGKAMRRIRLPAKRELERQLEIVRTSGIPLLTISGGWSRAFDAVSVTVARLGGGQHLIAPSPHHFVQLAATEINGVLSGFMHMAEAKREHL